MHNILKVWLLLRLFSPSLQRHWIQYTTKTETKRFAVKQWNPIADTDKGSSLTQHCPAIIPCILFNKIILTRQLISSSPLVSLSRLYEYINPISHSVTRQNAVELVSPSDSTLDPSSRRRSDDTPRGLRGQDIEPRTSSQSRRAARLYICRRVCLDYIYRTVCLV